MFLQLWLVGKTRFDLSTVRTDIVSDCFETSWEGMRWFLFLVTDGFLYSSCDCCCLQRNVLCLSNEGEAGFLIIHMHSYMNLKHVKRIMN